MKTILQLLILLFLVFVKAIGQEQNTSEIFIIGTMHRVPKIVKNSYKPLLKIAKAYKPDAIYVEYQRPDDSLSLYNYERTWFLPYCDSISRTFIKDPKRIDQLQKIRLTEMNNDDFKYLKEYYATQKDKANWYYYSYLYKYGISGSKKPLRNENGDLTAKLAIAMDINHLYAMDHQHETKEYTKKWRACIKASNLDGEIKYLIRQNRKSYRKAIIPAIFGRLGYYTNKQKTIKGYQKVNRFTFRKTLCDPCSEGTAIWDRRNEGIAKNIGKQLIKHHHKRAIVIIGAGHVIGVKDALQKQFPSIKVTIMDL